MNYSKLDYQPGLTQQNNVLVFIIFVLAFSLFLPLLLPVSASAKSKNDDIITLPWDNPAKKPVPPSFILPQQNRWGCLACHSSKALSKIRDGREASLFIDPEIIGNSMHKSIACIDCHTNFTYEEHPAESPEDFRKVAGLSCMKCHPFQGYLYKNSVHGELALKNKLGEIDGKKTEPALCSSCHGFHDIQSPRFEPYKSEFRGAGEKVCGECHTDRYDSYSDYYHGQAYKNKAKDAPVCWDCHGNHSIEKKKNDASLVTEANLPRTCGKCHDRPTKNLTSYAPLIHNRRKALEGNLIYRMVSLFISKPEVSDKKEQQAAIGRTEIITESKDEGLISRVFGFFFPSSLRPVQEK